MDSLGFKWVWSDDKSRINKQKHGLSFSTAALVFDDPLALSKPDPHPDGDRWQTLGLVGNVVLLVVHTWPEWNGSSNEEQGRIISARKATPHERRAYEEERH
ncbi:MAG: BrnT family toxin [Alphaproteobacteria bacterium]